MAHRKHPRCYYDQGYLCTCLTREIEDLLEACEMATRWLRSSEQGRSIPQVNGQPGGWCALMEAAMEKVRIAIFDTMRERKALCGTCGAPENTCQHR